ncbi:MAG: hypothetical protein DCF15_07300 [Phormidesmis priestleyi]|uniref:Uncharacterized protein n=1 Tax=Phormidesmis priestleyi TaxID=268141 RepID=A0A2W4ZGJ8_9CYAN|nr:MAG: hypothetical protein DCF15_07300 [Phormidesmis priestleyi]
MKKPNFSQMTRSELRAHILENREDDEAIEALIKRRNPNAKTYPFPKTEADFAEMQEILKRQLNSINAA